MAPTRQEIRKSPLAALEQALPRRASLTLHLARGHDRDQPLEFVVGKMGADLPETASYVFANCFLTERVSLCQAGLAEGVLF
jgi:hypothetical protein